MIAEVIVEVSSSNVDKIFDYLVPPFLTIEKGSRVLVPFGPRKIIGYVLDIKEKSRLSPNKLKAILEVKPQGKILPEMLKLFNFMVKKYNIKNVDALRLFVSNEVRKEAAKEKFVSVCYLCEEKLGEYNKKMTDKALAVVGLLKTKPQPKPELTKTFGASTVNTLEKHGIILTKQQRVIRTPITMHIEKKSVSLNPDQQNAVKNISQAQNKTFVLFGVTGSGKTEVYMNVIENVLSQNKTAILLVPEISLTPQVFSNLKNRFGDLVAVLHSGLSAGERFDEWSRIENGEASVVVGARSAIFAPIKNLGVIIIDEEHENSYNSETNPRYKTKDIALFRANFNNCPLVLGSATPSVETFEKTLNGEYALLRLPHRVHQTAMPSVQIVDMTTEIALGNDSMFSRKLVTELANCFHNSKQALLFLNRRGYSSFMRCCECGYVAKCTDCDAPLVYHKEDGVLKCHFCGKKFRALTACPNCKSPHIRLGAVGTQQVVEEIKKLFPTIPVFRMDNDTTKNKNGHQKILQQFAGVKPAVLVGTQMIAKGHDFSDIEVVGIIDADQSLYQSDYKSSEKTFEVITQVAGRAGRKTGGGKVIIQTYSPRHFVYKYVANYDYEGFFDKEVNIRETTNYPPFATIVRVLISHENENTAMQTTLKIFNDLKPLKTQNPDDVYFLNAMKSPHTRLKNKFRFQVLLRFTSEKSCDIIEKIYEVVNKFKNDKCLIFVEINPSNLS